MRATPDDVMKSFDGSLELFENVGKAYIITEFCNFFGIEKVKDLPANNSSIT